MNEVISAVRAFMVILTIPCLAQAGIKDDIAAKEAQIRALQTEVTPLIEPILIKNSDFRVFLSLTPIAEAFNELNSYHQDLRTIRVQSIGRNGNFWRNGGTWCGSYVELDQSDSLYTSAVMSNFSGSIREDGAISLNNRIDVDGKVQLKFQFKGKRIYGPFGSNWCPPGGGVGTSIGVSFEKTIDMQLLLAFSALENLRFVNYKALFISPEKVSVTAQIGLGPIGTIGQPISFDLPNDPIASGSFPLLISNEGKFELPSGYGVRDYYFVLTPTGFTTNKNGITAAWEAKVQFE